MAMTDLRIVMEQDSEVLDEVVLIGYGSAKRRDLTGSIASVRLENSPRATLPNMNALDALKARLKIHSPSLAADEEVGQMIPPGIANGITKKAAVVKKAMDQVKDEALGSFPAMEYGAGVKGHQKEENAAQGIEYGALAKAIVDAVADAGIALKVDGRVAGRITRKAIA